MPSTPFDMRSMNPTLVEGLMRALAMKGDLPDQVEPKLYLNVNLLDLEAAELQYLRRSQLTMYRLASVAGPGFPSIVQVGPGAPGAYAGVVAKFFRFICSNNTAAAIQYRFYLASALVAGLALVSGAAARDDRLRQDNTNPLGCGLCRYGVSNTAAAPTRPAAGDAIITIPANATVTFEMDWIVTGRQILTIETVANNVPIECTALCLERAGLNEEQ